MTDDDQTSYPLAWTTEAPNRLDPCLDPRLDGYRPSAALRARLVDLWHAYVAREPDAVHTLLDVAADITEAIDNDHRVVARVLLALLEAATVTAVGAQGAPLTVRRLEADTAAARHSALQAVAHE